MKLLFDENLSPRLTAAVSECFPGSLHVSDCRLKRTLDEEVWNFAKLHGLAIVSKDSDFYNYSILRGHPPKSIWLRVGNSSTRTIVEVLLAASRRIADFGADPIESCLVLPVGPNWELAR